MQPVNIPIQKKICSTMLNHARSTKAPTAQPREAPSVAAAMAASTSPRTTEIAMSRCRTNRMKLINSQMMSLRLMNRQKMIHKITETNVIPAAIAAIISNAMMPGRQGGKHGSQRASGDQCRYRGPRVDPDGAEGDKNEDARRHYQPEIDAHPQQAEIDDDVGAGPGFGQGGQGRPPLLAGVTMVLVLLCWPWTQLLQGEKADTTQSTATVSLQSRSCSSGGQA